MNIHATANSMVLVVFIVTGLVAGFEFRDVRDELKRHADWTGYYRVIDKEGKLIGKRPQPIWSKLDEMEDRNKAVGDVVSTLIKKLTGTDYPTAETDVSWYTDDYSSLRQPHAHTAQSIQFENMREEFTRAALKALLIVSTEAEDLTQKERQARSALSAYLSSMESDLQRLERIVKTIPRTEVPGSRNIYSAQIQASLIEIQIKQKKLELILTAIQETDSHQQPKTISNRDQKASLENDRSTDEDQKNVQ